MMTPYECTLHKKWTQAAELRQQLANRRLASSDPAPEEQRLDGLIQQVRAANQALAGQLEQYQQRAETRVQLAVESDASLRRLTSRLWADIGHQFRGGTVANDLLKVLCQKIQRLPLPVFPVNRRKPMLVKELYVYEDSYRQLGEYFNWLVDLLRIVRFTPIRPPHCWHELQTIAHQYEVLNQQVRQDADALQTLQQAQVQLYRQLDQAMKAARSRLMGQKRQAQRQAG